MKNLQRVIYLSCTIIILMILIYNYRILHKIDSKNFKSESHAFFKIKNDTKNYDSYYEKFSSKKKLVNDRFNIADSKEKAIQGIGGSKQTSLYSISKTNSQNDNILFVVLTNETNILTRGLAIWNTWGRSCKKNIYFACNCSNIHRLKKHLKKNKTVPIELAIYTSVLKLPILNLNIMENEEEMGQKVLLIFNESYSLYKKQSNWFFMVDDDTYVYVNNLYKFIKTQNTSAPLYYGFKYKHVHKPIGFIGGGSGILFTNESLNLLVNKISKNQCNDVINGYGDVTIGGCAIKVGIKIGDSHDKSNRPRFNYCDPLVHFYGPLPFFISNPYGTHNGKIGRECCSLESISFHKVTPSMMLQMYSNKTFLSNLFE